MTGISKPMRKSIQKICIARFLELEVMTRMCRINMWRRSFRPRDSMSIRLLPHNSILSIKDSRCKISPSLYLKLLVLMADQPLYKILLSLVEVSIDPN
jgi:hypothetical protein